VIIEIFVVIEPVEIAGGELTLKGSDTEKAGVRADESTEKELHSAKTILEQHGIKVIKPIGSGSYSKVKVCNGFSWKTCLYR
jgi:hypothetical protein